METTTQQACHASHQIYMENSLRLCQSIRFFWITEKNSEMYAVNWVCLLLYPSWWDEKNQCFGVAVIVVVDVVVRYFIHSLENCASAVLLLFFLFLSFSLFPSLLHFVRRLLFSVECAPIYIIFIHNISHRNFSWNVKQSKCCIEIYIFCDFFLLIIVHQPFVVNGVVIEFKLQFISIVSDVDGPFCYFAIRLQIFFLCSKPDFPFISG